MESELLLGEDTPAGGMGGSSSAFVIVRMLLVLLLAAAAIYGLVFFLKRAARPSARRDPYLRVASTVGLGSNRFVHIIAVGSRAWLVGASDGGVSLLSEIEDQEMVAAILAGTEQEAPLPGGALNFKAILQKFGGALGSGVPSPDNIRRRRERIRGVK